MAVDQWSRVQELFESALERDPRQRRAFLERACEGEPDLLREVESLLSHHEAGQNPLDTPAVEFPGRGGEHDSATFLIGRKIGGCTLKSIIGFGGMSTVYLAEQESPRREVAVKFMKAGAASPSSTRRFEFESQILASLRHPNIAQVYETGTHDEGLGGIPYFIMEYVPHARTITEYAQAEQLDLPQRLELFARVCDAVHHGHQKGIIHRDLKPGNILVDAEGEPKIIDFGVARATDSDLALTTAGTDVRHLIGTLQYMSPEQCAADPTNVDVRSDVFALGVVLYELLCDRLPYDLTGVALHEAARVIREQPPARPSSVDRMLGGDVETIALKAMEKEPGRRYRSAAELAGDIRRYLRGEPIAARPPSAVYHLRLFVRRNRTLVGAVAALFLVLAAGTAASTWFALRLNEATKLPRAMQALLSSQKTGWLRVRAFDRFPANLVDNPEARNVLVCDAGQFVQTAERAIVDRHGDIILFSDAGVIDRRHELRVPGAAWIDPQVTEEVAWPLNDSVIADIWPGRPGKEIVVALPHRDFSPSVLRVYDGRLSLLATLWSDGHIHRVYWNERAELLLVLARSNALPDAVPDLNRDNRPTNADTSAPLVLAAIRPEDLAAGEHVLYPLKEMKTRPAVAVQWMLAEPWPELYTDENGRRWKITLVGLDEPDSDYPDALGRLRFLHRRVDDGRNTLASTFYRAHLSRDGVVMDRFVDEDGRRFTAVTGRPDPEFRRIDFAEREVPAD
ncbi:MAG: serine/threonine-protein kinase [Planctomycetota bacterium]|nr:serine/threonine-protein kinase [Planctomycetota bacterium]